MNYSKYTAAISNEPSYYGTECTQDDADRSAASLTKMIESEFPGINVTTSGSKTTGPDSEVIHDINDWISNNWTAAL